MRLSIASLVKLVPRFLLSMPLLVCCQGITSHKDSSQKTIVLYGLSRVWRGVTNQMGRFGDSVNYLVLRVSKDMCDSDTPSNCVFEKKVANSFRSEYRLLKNINIHSIEVYFHEDVADILAFIFLAKTLGINVVAVCTGAEVLYLPRRHILVRLFFLTCMLLADSIVIKEPYMEGNLKKIRWLNPLKIHFINNGVPETKFDLNSKNKREILFLNSFKRWRNLDTLVEAAKRLADDGISFNLRLVGARDNTEFGYAVSLIKEFALEGQVDVEMFTSSTQQYLRRASVFVLVADHVYANNALLEAMMVGCVPIVSDAPRSDEIVRNGENGFVVPLGDSVALAERIALLIQKPILLNEFAQNAHDWVKANFSESERSERIGRLHRLL